MRGRSNPQDPAPWRAAPRSLEEMFDYLHLLHGKEHFRQMLEQAAKDNISHEEFLKRLLSAEAASKFERQVNRNLTQARFPFIKTLEEFDFAHPVHIPRAKLMAAADLGFIERSEGFVFIASHGLGKTHLAIALGYRAALAGVRVHFTKAVEMVNHLNAARADHSTRKAMRLYSSPELLIIDELGRVSLDQKDGEQIFNVIDARYERGSTILTTNRAFRDWGRIFADEVCAKGIIDRLIHHSEVIKIEGVSYRIKDRKSKTLTDDQP